MDELLDAVHAKILAGKEGEPDSGQAGPGE
jgi:hypothetical protein